MSISNRSSPHRGTARGFTLIELLVVLTLMGSLLALVGPLSVESVERFSAQRELRSLHALLKAASARAFTRGRRVIVELEGAQLRVSQPEGQSGSEALLQSERFEHLRFSPTAVAFSRGGFPSTPEVHFTYRDQPQRLDLAALLSGRPGPRE